MSLDTQRRQVTDVYGTLMMTGADRLGKVGKGKYDMWYDWVVKTVVSSCMSVGRPLETSFSIL